MAAVVILGACGDAPPDISSPDPDDRVRLRDDADVSSAMIAVRDLRLGILPALGGEGAVFGPALFSLEEALAADDPAQVDALLEALSTRAGSWPGGGDADEWVVDRAVLDLSLDVVHGMVIHRDGEGRRDAPRTDISRLPEGGDR